MEYGHKKQEKLRPQRFWSVNCAGVSDALERAGINKNSHHDANHAVTCDVCKGNAHSEIAEVKFTRKQAKYCVFECETE